MKDKILNAWDKICIVRRGIKRSEATQDKIREGVKQYHASKREINTSSKDDMTNKRKK